MVWAGGRAGTYQRWGGCVCIGGVPASCATLAPSPPPTHPIPTHCRRLHVLLHLAGRHPLCPLHWEVSHSVLRFAPPTLRCAGLSPCAVLACCPALLADSLQCRLPAAPAAFQSPPPEPAPS